jgi:hypothetical protein
MMMKTIDTGIYSNKTAVLSFRGHCFLIEQAPHQHQVALMASSKQASKQAEWDTVAKSDIEWMSR